MNRSLHSIISAALGVFMLAGMPALAQDEIPVTFSPSDPELDALVDQCLDTQGLSVIPDTDVICYNDAIFPEQFLKLNTMEQASRIIITSPGGNVATARGMSGILDRRGEPVVIAGPCMSACAMVILPGLDQVHIHSTAHIAVHGIVMMPYNRWWGWERNDQPPTAMAKNLAMWGYDFPFAMYSAGTSHMKDHLTDQGVDVDYIQTLSDAMEAAARDYETCRVNPVDYWGMVDAEHIQTFLGDKVIAMEDFAENWSDPDNQNYTDWGVPISDQTYIMANVHSEEC